jgi:hypothetical protein
LKDRSQSRISVWWLVVVFLSGFLCALWADDLVARLQDDKLQITAPKLHFLAGRPLERLKDGATVPFDFQLTMWVDQRDRVYARSLERFAISYDLWEESFSVTQLRTPRRSASRLSSPAAEAWCLDKMSLSAGDLRPEQPVWLKLEVRAGDGKEQPVFGRGNVTESGISLTSLIEIFSRPATSQQRTWTYETGPLKVSDLRKARAGA